MTTRPQQTNASANLVSIIILALASVFLIHALINTVLGSPEWDIIHSLEISSSALFFALLGSILSHEIKAKRLLTLHGILGVSYGAAIISNLHYETGASLLDIFTGLSIFCFPLIVIYAIYIVAKEVLVKASVNETSTEKEPAKNITPEHPEEPTETKKAKGEKFLPLVRVALISLGSFAALMFSVCSISIITGTY